MLQEPPMFSQLLSTQHKKWSALEPYENRLSTTVGLQLLETFLKPQILPYASKKNPYIYIHIHVKEGAIPIALKAFTDDKSKLGYIGSQGPSTADLTPNKIWFPEENLGNTKD